MAMSNDNDGDCNKSDEVDYIATAKNHYRRLGITLAMMVNLIYAISTQSDDEQANNYYTIFILEKETEKFAIYLLLCEVKEKLFEVNEEHFLS